MPGTNAGTGRPLTLRCAKCRLDYVRMRERSGCGTRLERTGRKRPLSKAQEGNGGLRVLLYQLEYRCLDCGHVGWTRMKDVLIKPLAAQEKKDV